MVPFRNLVCGAGIVKVVEEMILKRKELSEGGEIYILFLIRIKEKGF